MSTGNAAAASAIRAERHIDAGRDARQADVAAPDEIGPVSAHLLAYADLVGALMQSWQRSLAGRALGAVLALVGIGACLALLTIGGVAAAWPTAHRWTVLLLIAGAYLAAGLVGIWLVRRRAPIESPAGVLIGELRKDAELISTALRQRSR